MTTDVQLYSTSANFDYQRTQKQQPQLSQFELRRKNNILRVLSNLKMSKATNNSEIYAAIEELRRENERVVAELSSTQDLLDLFERYRVLIREHMDFCVCAGKDHQMTKWRKYEQEYRQLVPIRSTMVTPPNVCLPKKAVMGANRSLNPFINDNISHSNQHSQSSSPVSELSTSTNNTTAKVQKGTIVIGPTGGASIKYSNTSGTNSSHPLIQLESKQSSLNGHLARHSHQSKHQNDLELQVVDPGKSLIRSFLDSSNSKTNNTTSTTTNNNTSSSPSSNRNVITNSQGNTIVIRKRTIPELIQSNQDGATQHKMVVIANKKAKLGNLQSNNNNVSNNYSNLKNILTMNKANVSQVSNEEEQSVEHLDQLNNALDQLLMGRYDALNKIQNQLRNNNNRLNQSQRFSGGNNQDGEDEEDDDDDGEESSSNDNGQLGTQDFEESGMVDGFTQEMFDTIRGAVDGTGVGADDDGDDEDDDEDDGDIIFLDEVKSNEQRQQTQQAQQHGQSKANTILSAALESGYKPYPTYHRIVTNVTNSLNADDSGSNILMDSQQQQQPSSKPMLIQKRPHLTSEERSDIIGRLKKNESGARIARDYGITKQAVSAIKRRAQLMGDNFQPINPSYYVALKNNTFAPLSSQLANNPNVQKAATITETSNGQFVAQRAIAKSPQQPQQSSKPSSMTMSLSSSSGDNSLVARQLKQQKLNDTIIKQSNLLAGLPRATSDLVLPVNPVAIIKSQMAKQRQQSDPNSPSSGSSPKIDHKRLLLPRLLQGTESYPPTSYQSGGSGKIIVNPASITGTNVASTSSPLKTLLTKSIEPKLSQTSSSSTNFLGVISNASPAAESINIKQEQLDEEIIKPVSNNNQEEVSEEEEEFDLNANDNANPDLMEFDGTIVDQKIRRQGQKNKVQVKAEEEEEEEEEENELEDTEQHVAGTVPGETVADDSNLDQDFDNNNNDMINFDDIDYIDNNDTAKPEAGESEEDSESEEGEEATDETQPMEPEAEIEEDGADEPQQEQEQEESQDNPEEESDANEEQGEGEDQEEEHEDMDQTAEEPQEEEQQEEEKDNSNSMVQADTNSD